MTVAWRRAKQLCIDILLVGAGFRFETILMLTVLLISFYSVTSLHPLLFTKS